MKDIPEKSVDLVLTDPPYGTTACKWDTVIPFEPMWENIKRVVKDNAAVCLFGNNPFTANLIMSNPSMFKHDWYWNKPQGTCFLNAKRYPLKDTEIISVFSLKSPFYNPQFSKGKPYQFNHSDQEYTEKKYGEYKSIQRSSNGKRYPKTMLRFDNKNKKDQGLSPTQKPVPLLEYLIKTYTLKGETVLDFTMGSGSTGVAAVNLGRKFIGIELEQKYFEIAKKRIEQAYVAKHGSGKVKLRKYAM